MSASRWRAAGAFAVCAFVGIIGGGLVAAVTGPLGWGHGSWAAAYLVLVVGVAQLGLGGGQAWLPQAPVSTRVVATELACWNVGSALVILGTLVARPWVVDLGGLLLVVALALFLRAVRRVRDDVRRAELVGLWCYRLLALVVLVSVPVGLVLSLVRHA